MTNREVKSALWSISNLGWCDAELRGGVLARGYAEHREGRLVLTAEGVNTLMFLAR